MLKSNICRTFHFDVVCSPKTGDIQWLEETRVGTPFH